jgi:CubicO group peptidase (beta-lactamase class C family)
MLVWQPGDKAAYSNLAYILLGYALENITASGFNDLLYSSILDPLGLKATGLAPSNVSDAAIPAGTGWSWYLMDIGTFKAYEKELQSLQAAPLADSVPT